MYMYILITLLIHVFTPYTYLNVHHNRFLCLQVKCATSIKKKFKFKRIQVMVCVRGQIKLTVQSVVRV